MEYSRPGLGWIMFAIITAALITGSIAERMKFPAFLLFILLWSTFVYLPMRKSWDWTFPFMVRMLIRTEQGDHFSAGKWLEGPWLQIPP